MNFEGETPLYQPSQEEIDKAEEMMTETEKAASQSREEALNKGVKRRDDDEDEGREEEGISYSPANIPEGSRISPLDIAARAERVFNHQKKYAVGDYTGEVEHCIRDFRALASGEGDSSVSEAYPGYAKEDFAKLADALEAML